MAIEQVPRIIRVTWKYDLLVAGGTQDTSQHSVCYQAGATPGDLPTIDLVLKDMAQAAVASQRANVVQSNWSPNVYCTGTRVALEGTNGHTLAEQFGASDGPSDWRGGSGASSLPWETSLCISLYGYQPGGFDVNSRSKRGRFYLPPMASDVLDADNSGRIQLTKATAIADQWGTVLQELQQHEYTGFPELAPVLVINSRKTPARPDYEPKAYPVTYLRFDNKIDSQKRRQRQETASGGSAPFPATP
uniref:Uncharacterized protein n=1 Tax=uncultured prokaryote TaxID=198431 RepID=A0A0H5Q3Q1_9ZZZZ|nr:hypothetical protein [uncultured prokaryote]